MHFNFGFSALGVDCVDLADHLGSHLVEIDVNKPEIWHDISLSLIHDRRETDTNSREMGLTFVFVCPFYPVFAGC